MLISDEVLAILSQLYKSVKYIKVLQNVKNYNFIKLKKNGGQRKFKVLLKTYHYSFIYNKFKKWIYYLEKKYNNLK